MALKELSGIEFQIITLILNELEILDKEQGPLLVEIYSGDPEPDMIGGVCRPILEFNIGASDETTLRVRSKDNSWVGSIFFVHGNDEDVVADLGGTTKGMEMMERLLLPAAEYRGIAEEV